MTDDLWEGFYEAEGSPEPNPFDPNVQPDEHAAFERSVAAEREQYRSKREQRRMEREHADLKVETHRQLMLLRARDAAAEIHHAETAVPADERLKELRNALLTSRALDDIPEPIPLIGGVLQMDSLAYLIGRAGNGKSFVAIDMAGCVGSGIPWQGFTTTAGPVLYLIAEGASGVKKRVRAWEQSMAQSMESVWFLPVAIQAKVESEWAAFVSLATEVQPAMVVVDTQARVTVGMEENSATDMGVFIDRAEQLRAATGACVLVVHHQGRQGDHMRGNTAMDGAATTIIRVTKEDETVTVECAKQKDDAEFAPLTLRLVQTGSSAVICLTDAETISQQISGKSEELSRRWWEVFETKWVSPTALMEATGIPKATVYRSLGALLKTGLAEDDGKEKRPSYRLKKEPGR